MSTRVDLVKVYYHPRTHRRISEAAAQKYNRRAKKKIKPQLWLTVRRTVGETRGLSPQSIAQLKKLAGRIIYSARLTTVKMVLPLRAFTERHVWDTLTRARVFKKMWEDFVPPAGGLARRGSIRITVNGVLDDRRIKEIIHLPFVRQEFARYASTDEKAYEEFKNWVVSAIITNLRRRGLRLSNAKESNDRIQKLTKKLKGAEGMLAMETHPDKQGGWMEKIKWTLKAIAQQKKTKQLKGAVIKIEKIV